MGFSELARSRHSVRRYTPNLSISDAELTAIFTDVRSSPSSFNLQHWRFVVVRDQARKQTLRNLAFGQQQVEDCAAVILVCGRLDAYADVARIYADAPAEMRDKYVPMIPGVYQNNVSLQREEAVRSSALAAMTLMYAAKDRGWDTGPMIGFDAAKVGALLELDANTIPVMMITLGKALNGAQPARLYRRPLAEIVRRETLTGPSLDAG
ncbi:MAG: nitroreductase family protein [Gammaproteobacteria bacterium]|nr:nitroreductase family protein [Gammaproteobacteria bacterium]